jgi:hypothetical protein
MLLQFLHIREQVRQLLFADFLLREGGHGAESMAHLRAYEEGRQGLIVQRRPKPRFSAGMTLLAILYKYSLSLLDLGRSDRHGAGKRLTPA